MSDTPSEYGALVKSSIETSIRGENPFILVVGGVIVTFISVFTVGLLTGPAAVGLARASLRMVRGQPVSLEDLRAGLHSFVPSLVGGLLVWLTIAVGTALLVVPGVVAAFVFTYVFHVLADHPETTGIQAMKDSFAVVKANPAPTVVFWVVALVVLGVFSLIPFVGTVVGVALTFVLAAQFFPGMVHAERNAAMPETGVSGSHDTPPRE